MEPSADRITIDDSLDYRNQRSVSVTLPEGLHVVVLANERSNEKRLTDTVEITAGRTASQNYRFTLPERMPPDPQLGELRIGSSPKGATIIIDGEEQQYKTNFAFQLPAGRHIVTALIDLEGTVLSKTDTVSVAVGATERLYFEFE